MSDEQKIEELLTRGVSEIIDREHLKNRLLKGEKLRVKLGIDPTSPNLHIGRSVVLLKLRDFQELGHQIVFIVGDFTGTIGDTSDKESERPMLSKETVEENMKTYQEQAGKILDLSHAEIYYNSEWLKKLGFQEIGSLADAFGLADFISRENIKRRLDVGKRVSLREVLYPLMQGYDSVHIRADVELGGTDQRFNLLAGRTLQMRNNQPSQDIVTTNLIMGTNGTKMSSSVRNTIDLTDSARDMFGKIMSVPDPFMMSYFVHATRIPMEQIAEYEKCLAEDTNPRDIKLALAHEITRMYCGDGKAKEGKEYFISVFQENKTPSDMPEIHMAGKTILEILVDAGLAESRSDAKRLIEQRGVAIDGEIVELSDETVHAGSVVLKGKRHFIKVV